jgi:predicted nucleotidyltransferase
MARTVLDTLIRSVVATYAPRRIVLFGSDTAGEGGPDSDLGLLVVLDDDVPPDALHWRKAQDARSGYDGPVDLIPCRESVFNQRASVPGSFADSIRKDGVVVYERADPDA